MSFDIEIPIDEVDALLASWDSTSSPGCAIAVLQRGNILYSKGYGMADLRSTLGYFIAATFAATSSSNRMLGGSSRWPTFKSLSRNPRSTRPSRRGRRART